MVNVRNPVSGFALTAVAAAILSGIVTFVGTLIPYMEFRLFYLGFALFAAGVLAGRPSFVGFSGFAGGYIGSFFGLLVAQLLFWSYNQWLYPMAIAFSLATGLGSWVTAKSRSRHLDRVLQAAPKLRRCPRCGAKVGANARKCWDCHAALPM